jgi:MarR family
VSLAAEGIRTRHAALLVLIDAEGPMSQRALGRRLRIDKSPMVGLIDDLEQLGLAAAAGAATAGCRTSTSPPRAAAPASA